VDGRDFIIDERYADGAPQAIVKLAEELMATGPDLLLAAGDAAILPLSKLTRTVPIVFAVANDPVGSGFVASLGRPGGNLTGITNLARDLSAKRLELLKEAVPGAAHIVVLFDTGVFPQVKGKGILPQVKELEDAARHLKIRVTTIELRRFEDIEQAITRGAAIGAQAYFVPSGPLVNAQRQAIADRLLRAKTPAMFSTEGHAEAGGLMSYAPSYRSNFRRAAYFVDRILKGARPADLPVEQPTKLELVINLKTAKALNIKIPNTVLLRADRVIE